ncbi:MAG TPA: BON domain-containing protein [Verrucomicrobiae bacterium]|nr:BON domain-containing protein [Verrucomicrobiae bacterium]
MLRSSLAVLASVCLFGAPAAGLAPESLVVSEIQDYLSHSRVPQHGDVTVSFAHGVATLSGTVDSLGVKRDAQNAARRDEDVIRIVNDIRVAAQGTSPPQILEQARKRLQTCYAYSIYDFVGLDVHGDTLIMSGSVTQPYKKDAIGNSLAHIKGVAQLENQITVLPLSMYDEDLRTHVARAIYDDPYFETYVDAGRLPIHIVVNEGGITLAGAVDSQFDRERAEQDARIAATVSDVTILNHLQVSGETGQTSWELPMDSGISRQATAGAIGPAHRAR